MALRIALAFKVCNDLVDDLYGRASFLLGLADFLIAILASE
jgi:hypothetical protein